jgi:hypothetical protein
MAIENFDHGMNRAAGHVLIGANAAASVVSAIGIRSAVRNGTGEMTLELVDPIGQAEMLALALRSDGQAGDVTVGWLDETHVVITCWDVAGDEENAAGWFVVYKVAGNVGGVPITDGPV